MAKDPICGMEVNEKKAKYTSTKDGVKYYFCSAACKKKFEKSTGFQKFIPFALVSLLIILAFLSYLYDFMPQFMGWFFVSVSILKMLDWRGFANAFAMYDILAKKIPIYSWIYPSIEFILGILFIFDVIKLAAVTTIVIMSIGTIGVARNLLSKNPVRCACLGTLINIPLTKFTLFEDILMIIMAIMVLLINSKWKAISLLALLSI